MTAPVLLDSGKLLTPSLYDLLCPFEWVASQRPASGSLWARVSDAR